SSMRSPRCMKKIPPTTSAMHPRPMAKATAKSRFIIFRSSSELARDPDHLFHRLMRRCDQGAIEQVCLQADLALVAVLVQRGHYGAPVFFLRAFRHDALALHLHVEDALFRKQSVALRVCGLLAPGVVRVPIQSHPLGRHE